MELALEIVRHTQGANDALQIAQAMIMTQSQMEKLT